MSDEKNTDDSDAAFRAQLSEDEFKPDSSGMKWAAAQPRILVSGAYDAIRSAADRARKISGRGRE